MSSSAADISSTAVEKKRRSFLADVGIRLVKEKPLGTAGGIITLILLFTAVFADLSWLGLPEIGLAPYGMNELSVGDYLSGPSFAHPLGVDHLGRDVLSRVIFGARISVIIGLAATTLSIIISTVIGIPSGFMGGKFDMVVQRFVDTWMIFPGLVVLLVAVSLLGPGMLQIILLLGLVFGIGGSRVIRSAVIGIKQNMYLEAARATGCSTMTILVRHILPNIMAPIIILFTVRTPAVILVEATLSFLGLGIPPPAPSWGGMLSGEGRSYMFLAPWLAIWPGLALTITVYGINMFGDALRDLLDPRLRGGVGRYERGEAKKPWSKLGLRLKRLAGRA